MADSGNVPTNRRVIGESTDPIGVRILLFEDIWRCKILRDHSELSPYFDAVLRTVSSPDHIAPDPVYEKRRRFYLQGAGPSRWLLAVVSYEQNPARIISAFGNRKDPPSWSR